MESESQSGRLIAVEAGIVASEQLALQSVRFKQNISRNPLPFHLQVLPQAIHCLYHAPMNHRIASCDLDVASRALHKGFELDDRIFALIRKRHIKGDP